MMALYQIYNDKITHDTIDGEAVIIHFDSGLYYSLRGSGSEIWQGIVADAAFEDMTTGLLSRYDVSEADARQHLARMLRELAQEDILALDHGALDAAERGLQATAAPTAPRAAFEPPTLTKYSDMQMLLLIDPIHGVEREGWPQVKPADGQ